MTEVEVRAAQNVLEACAQTETIDKVVFTSSATAVICRDDRKSEIAGFDERHWSDLSFCRKFKLWHALSKTQAEKTTWALAMDRGVNMEQQSFYEDGVFVTVDLNFLVDAHICIYEDDSSYGRYLCFNHVVERHRDAMEHASRLTPFAPSPPPSFDQDMKIFQRTISNKKLNKLMVGFESGPQLDGNLV
uniref:3-beta hydroxysteroid dehydrogenase/isomerase domain-containing protein n=1 Tax=Salix viminalis TaxID=40686 RepID=A0A6N2KRC9_SALVM